MHDRYSPLSPPPSPGDRHPDNALDMARQGFIYALVAPAVATGLFVLWQASSAFFLIFGGILLAAAFDGVARVLEGLIGLSRRKRVMIAVALLALVIGVALFFGLQALVSQFGELTKVIDEQIGNLEQQLIDMGLISEDGQDGSMASLFPDSTAIFSGTTSAVLSFFGGLGNIVILLFLGVFFAVEPSLYKRGIVSLFPPRHRSEIGEALGEAGHTLRHWLIGQTISMGIIFVVSLVVLLVIGMPFAVLLAVQAGLLAFIPLLGPVLAGVPIVLAGLAESPTMALWGVAAYILIQGLESNIIQPVVQKRTVRLAPALTLSLQLVVGVLFGLLGVALAVPLGAAAQTLVKHFWVDGVLGGSWTEEQDTATAP